MRRIITIIFLIISSIILTGCTMGSNEGTGSGGAILKSSDGGKTWEAKDKIDDQKSIAATNVLSIAVDPYDNQKIYLGTEKDGLLVSRNGGENWIKTNFVSGRIYGLVIDFNNSQNLVVSGVWNGRAKIFKSANAGTDWKEIYSEPANGPVISSLTMSKFNSLILYAGTSEGMIFKSTDGGTTWKNLYKAGGPVVDISFDSNSDNVVYFGIFGKGVLRSKDRGESFENISSKISKSEFASQLFSIAVDPSKSGTLYVGLGGGIAKSENFGDDWKGLNLLESSKKFPIKGVAINPRNSEEIIYVSAQAVYRSENGGAHWSTYQMNIGKSAEVMIYDPVDSNIVYIGFRKN